MIKIAAEDRALQNITTSDIVKYLEQGYTWVRTNYPNKRLIAFEGPEDDNGEGILLVLPAHNEFLDAKERIADAINLLAAIERLSPSDIIQKIRTIGHDTILLRMLTPANSSPSLKRAFEIVEGLRDLVFFAACMEEVPRAYIPGKRQKIGHEQVQICRFGQTFSGSFGFTIEIPLSESQLRVFGNALYGLPMERRIAERITRGFALIGEAQRYQNPKVMIDNFSKGMNYNMCNALLKIAGQDQEADMEYTVLWSPFLSPSENVERTEPVLIYKGAYRYIQEAANYMRNANLPDIFRIATVASPELLLSERQVIRGKIVNLSARSKNQRVATISWDNERQVDVPLHPDLYEIAFKAHIEFLEVSVIGRLIKRNGDLILTDVADLKTEE